MTTSPNQSAPATPATEPPTPPEKEEIPAVLIRKAYKSYGRGAERNRILSNLNMTVIKGTIYGLVGASGCGKTTLLSCILGTKKLDSGKIYALGGEPGHRASGVPGRRVGFMPQEIALFGEFSIKETMRYFGWIYNMNTYKIDRRSRFLIKLLILPKETKLVKNLREQKRRVSFAIALLHDPELLILDEPTVSVDPLLRQIIWEHLVAISKLGETTIIITTHYIEEATEAHYIGVMRNGRLLAEEPPAVLVKLYEAKNLEEVFLKLSRPENQKTEIDTMHLKRKKDNKRFTIFMNRLSSDDDYRFQDHDDRSGMFNCCHNICNNFITRGKIKALLMKSFLKIWRNTGVTLFMFGLPIIQVILFCVAIGIDPVHLSIAIVNEEKTDSNNDCPFKSGCEVEQYGCRYLSYLKGIIEYRYYTELEKAMRSVLNRDTYGVIFINNQFTNAFIARGEQGSEVSPEDLENSQIKVWIDMSEQQIGLLLSRQIQVAFIKFNQELLTDCGKNPDLGSLPVSFQGSPFGTGEPSFNDFSAPGICLTIIFFLAVASTSTAMIDERREGLLNRSYIAGVTPVEVLLAHMLTQFCEVCSLTARVLIFMLLVFQIQQSGKLIWVILLTLTQGLCGVTFGFLISSLYNKETTAMQLSFSSFYPMLLLSGVIWPIEGMGIHLRRFAMLLPLTLPVQALRSVQLRAQSFSHFQVYMGFVTQLCWVIFCLIITLIILKNKKN